MRIRYQVLFPRMPEVRRGPHGGQAPAALLGPGRMRPRLREYAQYDRHAGGHHAGMTILGMSRPNHTTRLWLLGYLIACGYSKPEIQSLIYDSNQWKDYNEEFTENMGTSFIPGKMPLDSLVTMEELLMDKWSTPSQPSECSVKSPMVKFADRFNRQFFWGARY